MDCRHIDIKMMSWRPDRRGIHKLNWSKGVYGRGSQTWGGRITHKLIINDVTQSNKESHWWVSSPVILRPSFYLFYKTRRVKTKSETIGLFRILETFPIASKKALFDGDSWKRKKAIYSRTINVEQMWKQMMQKIETFSTTEYNDSSYFKIANTVSAA
jgi:hypothetical protein